MQSAHVSAHERVLVLDNSLIKLVGAAGFEPAARCSQIWGFSWKISAHSELFMRRSEIARSKA
jgi:hypothetical protein